MSKVVIGATITTDVSDSNEKVKSFKQQLREAQNEVVKLSEKFGPMSKEAAVAAQKAAALKDAIGDAKELTEAFNPDKKFQAFSNSINGVVGGFAALQGAMGLLGVESEDTQKALLKVQSALALSQGLSQITASVDAFRNLGSVIRTQVVGAFSTLKGAIAATGIGLAVIAVTTLIAYFESLSSAAEKAAEDQKKALEVAKKFSEIGLKGNEANLAREQELAIARAKNAGKSEKEIFDIQRSYQKKHLDLLAATFREDSKAGLDTTELQQRITDLSYKAEVDKLNFETDQHNKRLAELKKFNTKMETEAQRLAKQKAGDRGPISASEGIADSQKEQADRAKKEQERLNAEVARYQGSIDAKIDAQVRQNEAEKALTAERIKLAEEEAAAKVKFTHDIGDAAGALSDLIGKQTAVGKGLAIAQATINTWQGATEVLRSKSILPEPAATISKVVNFATVVATGLTAVKNILKTQVPGGGGSGSGGGGAVSATAPLTPQLAQSTQLQAQQINNQGNQAVKAFVVESDVTNNQERIRRLNRAARIG